MYTYRLFSWYVIISHSFFVYSTFTYFFFSFTYVLKLDLAIFPFIFSWFLSCLSQPHS